MSLLELLGFNLTFVFLASLLVLIQVMPTADLTREFSGSGPLNGMRLSLPTRTSVHLLII